MAYTAPSADGFHGDTEPVVASRAPSRLRVCPPSDVNSPPARMVAPLLLTAYTGACASALPCVASPDVRSRTAIRLRGWPPIEVNAPPATSVLASASRAYTFPLAFGFQDSAAPVEAF